MGTKTTAAAKPANSRGCEHTDVIRCSRLTPCRQTTACPMDRFPYRDNHLSCVTVFTSTEMTKRLGALWTITFHAEYRISIVIFHSPNVILESLDL